MARTKEDLTRLYNQCNQGGPDRPYFLEVLEKSKSSILLIGEVPVNIPGGPFHESNVFVVPFRLTQDYKILIRALFDRSYDKEYNQKKLVRALETNEDITEYLERWDRYDEFFAKKPLLELMVSGNPALMDDPSKIKRGTKIEVGLVGLVPRKIEEIEKEIEKKGFGQVSSSMVQLLRRYQSRYS